MMVHQVFMESLLVSERNPQILLTHEHGHHQMAVFAIM
jgi:hypothetical protein